MSNPLNIGFDAREMWLTKEEEWGGVTGRMDRFITLNIDKPLSIEPAVWPPVFEFFERNNLPKWTGVFQDLWEDLGHLQKYLASPLFEHCCYSIVGFSVNISTCSQEDRTRWENIGPTVTPSSLDPDWSFLGYDVADPYGYSSLITMMPAKEIETSQARKTRWSPHLNRAHLFDEKTVADEFRERSNRCLPSHAPFYVYGIWLIQEVNGAKDC